LAENTKQTEPKTKTIGDEIDQFVRQIDSLADTLPEAIRVIAKVHHSSSQEYNHFLKNEGTPVNAAGNEELFNIESGKYFKFRRLQGRLQKAQLAGQLVPRIFLVSLVSQFDAFLGRLIKQIFNLKPDALDSSGGMLTFSQLTEFGSIENAREYLIEKEIESVLRRSHSEQFDWLENKFGLKLRVDLKSWPLFIELTERRNLFVHTDGMVSRQYLEVCARHGATVDPKLAPGSVLWVDRHYFETAHECLFEIGVKLAQVLWRKLNPIDLEPADQNLLSVGYQILEEGRYRLARCLLDFSTETLKRHGKEELRLSMVVNRAQAYKWSGDDGAARKIVDDVDWSATALKFQLAAAVLLDNFAQALSIMPKLGPKDPALTKMAYREWPLFREIRKSPQFAKTFEEIFEEPFNIVKAGPTTPGTQEGGLLQ
jgi:hypothetical protein